MKRLVLVVVIVPAILSVFVANPSSAKPLKKKPPSLSITGTAAAASAASADESFFKRVIRRSVAHFLFPLYVTLEIIWNSTGAHSDVGSLADDRLVDARVHRVCAAIVKLWTDLRTLEHAQLVYHAELERIVNAEDWSANETYADIVAKIDRAYAGDAILGQRYVRYRDEEVGRELRLAANHSDVELALTGRDRDRLLLEHRPLGARLMLFKFQDELRNQGEKSKLARVLVAVSKEDAHYSRVQKLFENALNDVGPAFGVNGTDRFATQVLFEDLKKKIAEDADLRSAFERKKNALRL